MPAKSRAKGKRRVRVRVVATGGTIASTVGTAQPLAEPELGVAELLRAVPKADLCADVEVEEFSRVPSSQLSVQEVYSLATRLACAFRDDAGLDAIVVTHGTGTMEESAFCADLLVKDSRPIIFTGAMRTASACFPDGPDNLQQALRVAGCPSARHKGVLVVMGGLIHSGREAHKAHTVSPTAIVSAEAGPLGCVYPDGVYWSRPAGRRRHILTDAPVFDVDLIKFVVGMDDRHVRASVAAGAAGLVIEGSGNGNVNDIVASGIATALDHGVVTAICSRTGGGPTVPMYGTRGGAGALAERGCLVSSLSGPKTRIALMLALGITRSRKKLQSLLDAVSTGLQAL